MSFGVISSMFGRSDAVDGGVKDRLAISAIQCNGEDTCGTHGSPRLMRESVC